MPTVFTHAVVPLMLGAALPRQPFSWRLVVFGAACAMLPDADSISFRLGVQSGSLFAHRGMTHSIGFALLIAGMTAIIAPQLKTTRKIAFIFVSMTTLSHPIFDMLTNGGSGVALWFPFSAERVRFAWRPILVAPISLERFLTERGVRVMLSEFRWLWLPTTVLATAIWLIRRMQDNEMRNEE